MYWREGRKIREYTRQAGVIWQISDNYDRPKPARIAVWAILAWVVLLVCFFFMPPPNPHPRLTPVNINYVWGPSDYAAQSWVSPAVWHIGLMIGLHLLLFGSTHFLLLRIAPKPER